MNDISKEAFGVALARQAESLDTTIRSLTPASFSTPLGLDGTLVSDVVGVILKEALVIKSILIEGDTNVDEVKAPSFMGPDEAADIIKSAIEASFAALPHIAEPAWRASVKVEGSDRWRGETRGSIVPSFLKDLAEQEQKLHKVVVDMEELKKKAEEVSF